MQVKIDVDPMGELYILAPSSAQSDLQKLGWVVLKKGGSGQIAAFYPGSDRNRVNYRVFVKTAYRLRCHGHVDIAKTVRQEMENEA